MKNSAATMCEWVEAGLLGKQSQIVENWKDEVDCDSNNVFWRGRGGVASNRGTLRRAQCTKREEKKQFSIFLHKNASDEANAAKNFDDRQHKAVGGAGQRVEGRRGC